MQSSRLFMSVGLALCLAITVQAQSATRAKSKAPASEKVSVIGCVERADQVSGPSTAGTTVDSLSFVLIHAMKVGAASQPDAVGTKGTPAPEAGKGATYRLDASMAKLNPHVGHKVEITGSLQSAAPAAATTDPAAAANAPRLTVDTVKMMSETCAR